MQQVSAAALWDKLRGGSTMHVKKLTQEEVENFKIWRTHFLEEGIVLRRMGWKWMPSGCAIGRIRDKMFIAE